MFTKSATPATPVSRPKSHITDSVTWVKDWYDFSKQNPNSSINCILKGWIKQQSGPSESEITVSSDILDLDRFKYYTHEEASVTDNAEAPDAVGESENSDLKSALSMNQKDDQVSTSNL